MYKSAKFMILIFLAFSLVLYPTAIQAGSILTQTIKGVAIGFIVTKTAGPLDKFINTITLRHGMQSSLATKVVPILSVGEKGYVGGAQVCGPKAQVDKVDAVFQYEKNFSHNNYRAKVLLPSASLNPLKLERVPQVGVSAIIDVSLDGRLRHKTVGTGVGTGDVVRGAAVLVAVKNFGPEINKAINTLTFNKGYATKFVPMASFGEKMYLGGAQVSAQTAAVDKVNAVWQYEDLFSDGRFRVKVLIPTTSSNPLKMKRVDSAGITAVVDMSLSQQEELESAQLRQDRERWDLLFKEHGADFERYLPRVVVPAPIRHDQGKHKGWYLGEHKGWDKKDETR